MTVTIVMSTYNGEKYLREQINSILRQEKTDFMLFIRDDGSADGTLDILREYAAKYENIMFSAGNNLGAGRSFYEALRLAPDAPYYAFADQDDVWLPDKMIAGIEALESCKNDGEEIPLLYSCRTVSADSELIPLKDNRKDPIITFGTALLENMISGCTFVFNRRAKELYLAFPAEKVCIHDWDLLRIVLAAGGKVVQDDNAYILYRQHGTNAVGADVSRRHRAGKLLRSDPLQMLKKRLEFADDLRKIYEEIIPEENRRLLDILCDRRKSFSARMDLVRSEEIVRTDKTDNFVLKALFFLDLL